MEACWKSWVVCDLWAHISKLINEPKEFIIYDIIVVPNAYFENELNEVLRVLHKQMSVYPNFWSRVFVIWTPGSRKWKQAAALNMNNYNFVDLKKGIELQIWSEIYFVLKWTLQIPVCPTSAG